MSQVKNAADRKQVKKAKNKLRDAQIQAQEDLRFLMQSPQGQRFLMRLLGKCRLNQSIWHPSAAIHKNAGIQEVGQEIYKEMLQVDAAQAVKLVANEILNQMQGDTHE